MDDKITMPMLASMLAEKTGYSKKQCEDFLREFFVTVSDTLASGENVKIKGLGTFRIINVASRKSVDVNTGESIEIPGHNKIVFAASKELAEVVNEPFSIFESVELDESYEDSNGMEAEYSAPGEVETTVCEQVKAATTEYVIEDGEKETEPSDCTLSEKLDIREQLDVEESMEEITESPVSPIDDSGEHVTENSQEYDNDSEEKEKDADAEEEIAEETLIQAEEFEKPRRRRFGFFMGFACGIALMGLAGLGIWYFYLGAATDSFAKDASMQTVVVASDKTAQPYKAPQPVVSETPETLASKNDNLEESPEVPTAASDQPVYDTISKTRFLTTMAKDHYGNFNLWPYIYEENKSFLGHPDRIKPGTKVVIPSLSKYGIDPTNQDDIKKAKRKGVEIYSKYK